MTLADMITSFVDDDWQRTNLLKLMGMEMPSASNVKKDKWIKLLHYSKVNKIDITIWTKLRIEKFE